jgi:hypothetical protein
LGCGDSGVASIVALQGDELMPLLVCHMGWMTGYKGLEGKSDEIVGGGSHIDEYGDGGEVCNFFRCKDANVYGHVETMKKNKDRPINIELLGAAPDAKYIDGVDVLWTATHPKKRGRRVVGWYRNARVFRNRQHFVESPSRQHKLDELKSFRVRAHARDTKLIALEERTLKLGHGKGWIGQANWWFPEQSQNAEVGSFLRQARRLLTGRNQHEPPRHGNGKNGNWGGNADPERKAEVERAAISIVKAHYAGFKIRSVEDEDRGWDLEAVKRGNEPLRLEVKGLFASDLKIGRTPREYRALLSHMKGKMDNYRLCVVAGALTDNPSLVIFRYSQTGKEWTDDYSGRGVSPRIKTLEAAIVSLS